MGKSRRIRWVLSATAGSVFAPTWGHAQALETEGSAPSPATATSSPSDTSRVPDSQASPAAPAASAAAPAVADTTGSAPPSAPTSSATSPAGYPATGYPATGYPAAGYPAAGYPAPGYYGYPTSGYPTPNAPGYPAAGYPAPGYPGYPATAYPGYAQPQTDPRPKYLPYEPGQAAPEGYQFDEEARSGPIIGGLITAGVPYLIGLLIAAQENYSNKKGFLVAPVVGPWLTLISRDSMCDPTLPINSCDEDFAARLALVLDGLLQTTGAALFAHGLFNTQKRYMRSDLAPKSGLLVTPRWVGQAPGLNVMGVF